MEISARLSWLRKLSSCAALHVHATYLAIQVWLVQGLAHNVLPDFLKVLLVLIDCASNDARVSLLIGRHLTKFGQDVEANYGPQLSVNLFVRVGRQWNLHAVIKGLEMTPITEISKEFLCPNAALLDKVRLFELSLPFVELNHRDTKVSFDDRLPLIGAITSNFVLKSFSLFWVHHSA